MSNNANKMLFSSPSPGKATSQATSQATTTSTIANSSFSAEHQKRLLDQRVLDLEEQRLAQRAEHQKRVLDLEEQRLAQREKKEFADAARGHAADNVESLKQVSGIFEKRIAQAGEAIAQAGAVHRLILERNAEVFNAMKERYGKESVPDKWIDNIPRKSAAAAKAALSTATSEAGIPEDSVADRVASSDQGARPTLFVAAPDRVCGGAAAVTAGSESSRVEGRRFFESDAGNMDRDNSKGGLRQVMEGENQDPGENPSDCDLGAKKFSAV